jgi:hypothetical protein
VRTRERTGELNARGQGKRERMGEKECAAGEGTTLNVIVNAGERERREKQWVLRSSVAEIYGYWCDNQFPTHI